MFYYFFLLRFNTPMLFFYILRNICISYMWTCFFQMLMFFIYFPEKNCFFLCVVRLRMEMFKYGKITKIFSCFWVLYLRKTLFKTKIMIFKIYFFDKSGKISCDIWNRDVTFFKWQISCLCNVYWLISPYLTVFKYIYVFF